MRHANNFFAFEGSDATGKATQTNLLKERLEKEGRQVRVTSSPRCKEISAQGVVSYLAGAFGPATELNPYIAVPFFSHDRFHAGHEVCRWVMNGYDVVADRWTLSNIAHQAAKMEREDLEEFAQWVDDYEHERLAIPRPFYLILYLPSGASQNLIEKRAAQEGGSLDGHESNPRYLEKTLWLYQALHKLYPLSANIDCSDDKQKLLSPEAIHEKVWQVVQPRLVAPP
jgi:dTMP kinase